MPDSYIHTCTDNAVIASGRVVVAHRDVGEAATEVAVDLPSDLLHLMLTERVIGHRAPVQLGGRAGRGGGGGERMCHCMISA